MYTPNYTSTVPFTTSDLTTISLIQYESYLKIENRFLLDSAYLVDSMVTLRISSLRPIYPNVCLVVPVASIFIDMSCIDPSPKYGFSVI